MKKENEYPEILTLEQAAEYLQVSARTIQRLVKTGEIPGRQVGSQWRFLRDQLRDWVGGEEPALEETVSQADLIKLWADKSGLDLPQPLIDLQQKVLQRSLDEKED